MKKEILDTILDNMLKDAIPKYLEKTDREAKRKVEYSKEHEEKMAKIFAEVRRKERIVETNKMLKRVAIVLIVICVLSIAFNPSICNAWKEKIVEFFIKAQKEYSWIVYDDPAAVDELIYNPAIDNTHIKIDFLEYIPEGYILEKADEKFPWLYINFQKDNSKITLKISATLNTAIDTENTHFEQMSVDETDVYYMLKGDIHSFCWNKDKYILRLNGSVDKEELIKLIEGIDYEKIEKYL